MNKEKQLHPLTKKNLNRLKGFCVYAGVKEAAVTFTIIKVTRKSFIFNYTTLVSRTREFKRPKKEIMEFYNDMLAENKIFYTEFTNVAE